MTGPEVNQGYHKERVGAAGTLEQTPMYGDLGVLPREQLKTLRG